MASAAYISSPTMASFPADNESDCSGDLKPPSIDFTRQFPTFELLDIYLRQYAADSNIVLSHNSKTKIPAKVQNVSDDGIQSEMEVKINERGWYYCSRSKRGVKSGQKCCFKVNYKYRKQMQMYELMSGSSCLHHNHPIMQKFTFNGKAVIQYEHELSPQEHGMISLMSSMKLSAPEFQVHLHTLFPNKIFQKHLLVNIKTKVLDNMHGKDRHNIPALATLSSDIIRSGGICHIVPDDSFGIESIHLQTKDMHQYTLQYGLDSPKFVDGTHGTSQYKFTAVPWTSIDGLGMSTLNGVTFNRTENAGSIVQGAYLFFNEIPLPGSTGCRTMPSFALNEKVSTLIPEGTAILTDEGPSFPAVCNSLGCEHIIDRKHFTQQIMTCSQHMNQQEQGAFRKRVYDVLDASTVELMEHNLKNLQGSYNHPKVNSFIQKISDYRTKLCWAHTSQFFTVAHISDQRSESTNSSTKGNGKLKSYLQKATMCESIERFIQISELSEVEKIKLLQDLRQKGAVVGRIYVDALKQSKINAIKLSDVNKIHPEDSHDFKYSVRRSHLDNAQSIVDLKGTLSFRGENVICVTCTCPFFTSARIICPCACAAAQTAKYDIDMAANIYPFWLVYNHPRYKDACSRVGLSHITDTMPNYFPPYQADKVEESTPACADPQDDIVQFNSRIFDNLGTLDHLNEAARVVKYKDLCTKLQAVACQSPLHFKHTAAALIGLTNRLSSMQKGNTGAIYMSAVARQSGRTASNALDNKSSLCANKKRKLTPMDANAIKCITSSLPALNGKASSKTTNCSVCRRMNEPSGVYAGHRKDSSRCPHNPNNRNVTEPPTSTNDSFQVENVANVGIVKTLSV